MNAAGQSPEARPFAGRPRDEKRKQAAGVSVCFGVLEEEKAGCLLLEIGALDGLWGSSFMEEHRSSGPFELTAATLPLLIRVAGKSVVWMVPSYPYLFLLPLA